MALLQGEAEALDPETGERPNGFIALEGSPLEQTGRTLDAMVRLTKIYKNTIPIRDTAERIVATLPPKNYWRELDAVQAWVRDAVRYTRDVFDVETLKTPLETLRSLQGDCDDKALLAGTLLQSIGFAVRYVAIGYNAPDEFEHVYLEAKMGDAWVPVETTEPVNLGWTPEPPLARLVRFV